jgi:hypothetical protein
MQGHALRMKDGTQLVRWYPAEGLPDRPAELVDLNWQGGQLRLIATVYYATSRDEEDASVVLVFEGALAFAMFEENMDVITRAAPVPQLAEPYPYGGTWPYVEVLQSPWIEELAYQHGVWEVDQLRHFVITSRNMHLHVGCLRNSAQTCHVSLD